ncbi:flagellar assembly factor FliW [Desulfuromusa kysingii]|uniref:Flagellar assembly factor FliW n=1 Tax=Desulfuromusa kysingii TaxID=37625 RepID=A0A1H3VM26_9BACT|nr:flagellar assembly protein FliW [Desulfuromusa kysingii]SDZ75835.1 flagellar assembly factor FliW [Desulfuromusa kysingii]
MMKKIQSRFGEIEYDPENILEFPEGLIGFEELRHFIVMPNEKEGPLFWIQSVEDPEIAFVLTDPVGFYYDYKIVPDGHERKKLGIDDNASYHVLSVVTVPQDLKVTLNLAAPILFAPDTNRALQVVLEGTTFSSKTPLPTMEELDALENKIHSDG